MSVYRRGMDRRRLLVTSVAATLMVPLGVEAQQAGKVPRLGRLSLSGELSGERARQSDAIFDGLPELAARGESH
jgi:hypothetical protein